MLRLTLFGRFSAAGVDGAEIAIQSKKARGLLAYLALSPRKSRSREEIMALLWSDRGETQARASLRQVLVGLRKDLGEVASEALLVTNEAVALDPGRISIEAARQGEELLAGFHLHDPAFEDWLRDERLRHEDATVPSPQPPELPLPDKPSIAVLPFVNMSGDAEQEYFSDGITEDLITELSHFRSLFVIARNSAFTYKGRSVNVGEVGRELGVQYVVEGSVRKAGNRVRVTAQLVEAVSGNHLWAERFDHELDDIFAVQDEVTQAIVAALPGRLDEAVVARTHHKPTESLSAYDYLLKGKWRRNTAGESDPEARALFEKAIEIDPRCALAHAWIAWFHAYDVFRWGVAGDAALNRTKTHIEHALAIESNDAFIRAIASQLYLFQGRYDLAKSHSERALALNPNDPEVVFNEAFTLAYLGDPKAGIELIEGAMRRDPHCPELYLEGLFDAQYLAREYEKAIEAFMRWGDPPPHMYAELSACYAHLDRMEDAHAAAAEFERLRPEGYNFAEVARVHGQMCARPEDRDHWLEGYRKAGLEV